VEEMAIGLLDQFERGAISRRQLVQFLSLGLAALAGGAARAGGAAGAAAGAGAAPAFKATGVNHISLQVADYARARDFYAGLFGMTASNDNGKQCDLTFGDTVLIVRNAYKAGGPTPLVDHIAYTIADWDFKRVEAELKRRGLKPEPDFNSFHFVDPDGYDVQIAGKDFMKEPV
jgi:catechol 2,3-dioxygenase-like lactoylglutathione lyase family enzyme